MDGRTLDLFNGPQQPEPGTSQFLAMFEAWVGAKTGKGGRRPLREESAAVYRDMWQALVKWSVGEGISVVAITENELETFLRSRGETTELRERYAWRVLRLVELVLHHHARSTGEASNDAVARLLQTRPEIGYSNATMKDELPEFLDAADARALVNYLTTPIDLGSATWQDARNRCAVALHLGAGLTPSEVRALSLSSVHGRERGIRKIRAPANGTVLEHEAPLAGWAWRVLESWLRVRKEHRFGDLPQDILLPATKAGRVWGKTGHYGAVGQVLSAAGLPEAGGAYRLRHTFALRQLRRGRAHADVAAWLGVEEKVIGRYRWIIAAPVDVV